MVPPCFHPGKTESTVVVFSGWRTFLFRSANHPEATNITSPAILISPIDQPGSKENQDGQAEGEEEGEGRKICVDGDDIEFSGPLLVTFLRLQPTLFQQLKLFHNVCTSQGSSLSVLLKEFGKRRDLNCKCAASALVFCLKSFACKTCKDLTDILPILILKSEPHLQMPLP